MQNMSTFIHTSSGIGTDTQRVPNFSKNSHKRLSSTIRNSQTKCVKTDEIKRNKLGKIRGFTNVTGFFCSFNKFSALIFKLNWIYVLQLKLQKETPKMYRRIKNFKKHSVMCNVH